MSKKGKGHLFCLVVVSDFWTWFGPLHQFLSCCVSGVFSTCQMPGKNSGPKAWGLSYSESAQMSLLSSHPQEHLFYVSLARPRGGGVFGLLPNLLHHSPLSRRGRPHDSDLTPSINSVTAGNPWSPCARSLVGRFPWGVVSRRAGCRWRGI